MKGRLFLKILATYAVLVLLIILVLDFLHTPQIRNTLTRSVEEKMIGQGKIAALLGSDEIQSRVRELALLTDSRMTYIDAAGWVKADSEAVLEKLDNHFNRSEVQEARLKGSGSAIRWSRSLQEDMLYVVLPVKAGGRIQGYVRLARPLKDVRESIGQVYQYLYLTLFVITILAILLAVIFSHHIAAPIRRMKDFAEKMRGGNAPPALIMDSHDEIGQLAKAMNDVLQEQQEKIRLAMEEKGKLEASFASMVEGVLVLDSENHITASNRSLGRMLGKKPKEMAGKTPLEVFRSASLQDALNRFHQSGNIVHEEIVLGEEDPLTLEVYIADIRGLRAGQKMTIMVFHDVTRLKQLERMRSDFIVNVTHELKTPLAAIIGCIETLQDGAIDDTTVREKFLRIVHDHARRLDRLVNDLLALSALEYGETELRMELGSIATILEEILPMIHTMAEEKGIPIIQEIPDNLPPIKMDRDKVAQILLNVLDNAVKFTASGRIAVEASLTGEGDYLTLRISDTGQGIPQGDLPRIGERFYRVARNRSRALGGTGLGLSIVKHLMKAHGGRFEIDSHEGKGTVVSLFFPVPSPPALAES